MYTFGKINYNGVFVLNRQRVMNGSWALLPKSAKAVLPILLYHRDQQGKAFPSEPRIAIMSGVSEKTARSGIKALIDDGWITADKYTTTYGNQSYKYFLPAPSNAKGSQVILRKSIIEGGNWSMLKPTGKSLYIAIICNSEYDSNDGDNFKDREWGYCFKSIYDMARLAGITTESLNSAMNSLNECELIEKDGDLLKVFFEAAHNYKQDFLNERVNKSFGYLIKKRETKGLAKLHLTKQTHNQNLEQKNKDNAYGPPF